MSTNQSLWQARADALFNTTRTAKEDITGMQKIVNIMTDFGSELTVDDVRSMVSNNIGPDIFPETRPIIELEKGEPILNNRLITLDALLTCLDAFAHKQWAFFHNGFERNGGNNKKGYLSYSKRYPEELVYRATLDQIAFDLEVVQKAFTQSLRVGNSPEALKAIRLADKYVAFLLNLVDTPDESRRETAPQLINKTAAVTYMGKSFQARIVPYAPVALIGVPTTIVHSLDYDTKGMLCLDENGEPYPEDFSGEKICHDAQGVPNPRLNVRDFLAISHEVGHYIFRHGAIKVGTRDMSVSRAVYNLTPSLPAWLDDWVEEIFSDVFAAVTAGGAAGETAREIQLDNDPARLLAYDAHYPFGALRPYIYSDVLHLIDHTIETDSGDLLAPEKIWTGQVLERLWTGELAVRGINMDTMVTIGQQTYTLEKVRSHVLSAITSCLLVLARQYQEQTIETVGQIVSTRPFLRRRLRNNFAVEVGTSTTLPDWQLDKKIVEQLPRKLEDIPFDVKSFTTQLRQLLHRETAPPMLRLELDHSVKDTKWQLSDNGNPLPFTGVVGETVRVLGGNVRDIYLELLARPNSRFTTDRLPPEIWEVVFSMNGWTTGGPENDPVDPV